MSSKTVSIIVPCYNQAQYLDECLNSVLDQTYPNWECIIVNDGSPDNTEEVAMKWTNKDERFKYLYKTNGGLSSARNFGLQHSSGQYILFLDSDDLIEIKKLEQHMFMFVQEPTVDVTISGYRYFEDGSNVLTIMGRNNFAPEVFILKEDSDIIPLFNCRNPFVISAPIYKKELIEKVGFFDVQLSSLEDWDFNLRCALKGAIFHHIGYSIHSKTLIRLHNASMMRNYQVMVENQNLFYKKRAQNKDYIAYFGVKNLENKNIKKNGYKKYILMFVPPIINIAMNKVLKFFK